MGGERGYDGAKKVTGHTPHRRGYHGNAVGGCGHSRLGGRRSSEPRRRWPASTRTAIPRLQVLWADSKYHNHNLYVWVAEHGHFQLQIVSRPTGAERLCTKLPKRWVVERTFAWLGRARRLSKDKDYEKLIETSEAMLMISAIHMMVERLAGAQK